MPVAMPMLLQRLLWFSFTDTVILPNNVGFPKKKISSRTSVAEANNFFARGSKSLIAGSVYIEQTR